MSRFGKATYYCCPASDEIAKKKKKEKKKDWIGSSNKIQDINRVSVNST
jgi:hypothetical protein